MQKILKNRKGSISLFALLSALFFLVVVVSVAVSLKNKEASIDSQIKKVKVTYEKDVGNERAIYAASRKLSIQNLKATPNRYWGRDVLNYTETLDSSLNYMEWQVFYVGKLNENDSTEEDKIYLISKDYVKNIDLPTVVKDGQEVEGANPIPASNSEYKAKFSEHNLSGGVLPHYQGSDNITDIKLQKLNSKYFEFLNRTNPSQKSRNPNIKAVAYMLDTTTWRKFSTSSSGYAEYALGGPSLELLFTAYNRFNGLAYEVSATDITGYEVRKTSNDTFSRTMDLAIGNDTNEFDSPYSVSNNSNAYGYWLASPIYYTTATALMIVSSNGRIGGSNYSYPDNGNATSGFRPVICLNSNYTLELVKDTNGKDAFRIVGK